MSRKERSEWKEFIDKHNKPLSVRGRFVKFRRDYSTGMFYLELEGEMATKEVTTKVIQELLKLVSLPDEVYNAVKVKRDHIRKNYDESKWEKSSTSGKEGYVYFLKEYHGNAVKIGYSKNPLDRIKKMNFIPSIPVEIIHTIRSENAYHLEQMFHYYFSKKQSGMEYTTEFFELSEEDMQNIYNLNLPKKMLNLIMEEKSSSSIT